jgi:ABC-type branched-subunit amino acid transport system substrate-binding protein
MRVKKLIGVVVALGLLSMPLVVGTGAAGASDHAQASSKFTGDPIKIGLTFPCNAPTPPAICEAAPSGQAAAKSINSQGGVKTADGKTHEVQVILCNNQNDRTKIADCARQFVDAKVAFATGAVAFGEEIVPILGSAGIPYFAPVCASNCTAEGTASNAYIMGFTLGLFQGLVKELAASGSKKIVAVAQGAGVAIGALTKSIAESKGATLRVVEVPAQNPNWAQIVADATANSDAIFSVIDETGFKAFLDAFTQAGASTPVTSVIGIVTNELIANTGGSKSPLVDGVSTGYFPPPQDKAWADYRKGMKKYAKETQLEPAGQQMWLAVQLASTIMATINGSVTAQSFTQAVNATTSIPTLDGKLPPGKSFQKPEGIFPRIFNNDYWGPLKINGKAIANGSGAQFQPAPSTA